MSELMLEDYFINDFAMGDYKITIGINNSSSYKNGLIVHDSFLIINKDSIYRLFLVDVNSDKNVLNAFEGDYYDFVLNNYDFSKVSDLGADNVSLVLIKGLYSLIKEDLSKNDSNFIFNQRLKELDLSLKSLLLRK